MKKICLETWAMALIILSVTACTQIDTGSRGVMTRYGKMEGAPLSEGVHFYNPFTVDIEEYNVREQKWTYTADIFAKGNQNVKVQFTLIYRIDEKNVNDVFLNIGSQYALENNILASVVLGTIKDSIGKVTAVAEQERLAQELRQVKLEIANQRQEQNLALQKERANWELARAKERSDLEQEIRHAKSNLELEKTQAESKQAFAIDEAIRREKLISDETLVMKKLDFEQRSKQAELDAQSKILKIKEEYSTKETKLHAELHKEMYDKLNTALVDMSQKGDKNTQFVHELMLKIFEKRPVDSLDVTTRNYNGQLPAGAGTTFEVDKV